LQTAVGGGSKKILSKIYQGG